MSDRLQSPQEERLNVLTHAIGVLLALVLIPVLLVRAASVPMLLATGVFSFGFLMAYLSSTCYHWAERPRLKSRLRIWDHISIFLLIGGTYTPIVWRYLERDTALWFLGGMWTLILLGCVLKLFYTGRYTRLSTAIYLVIGWMAVLIIKPLLVTMPVTVLWWIVGGGLAYSIGVIFYRWKKLTYHHSIWHVFVLAGTLLHYTAVFQTVSGTQL